MFSGADLKIAADKSDIRYSFLDPLKGVTNAFGIATDLIRYRNKRPADDKLLIAHAVGSSRRIADEFSAVYAGNGANRDWCFSTVFEQFEITQSRAYESTEGLAVALGAQSLNSALVFAEGLSITALQANIGQVVTIPAWVRQRLCIRNSWQTQIAELKRGTRQELTRFLRKHQYTCEATHQQEDFEYFFDKLYRPYVLKRHGESGIMVSRERFMRECRRGVVLQLFHNGEIVAAAVLRRIVNTMAILWSGSAQESDAQQIHGVTDALDYFSLLYASAKKCRWLDFGRSRPSLNDGVLRYKRKWGAEFTAGAVRQSAIQLILPSNNATGFEHLQQQVFVLRNGQRFYAVLFINADSPIDDIREKIKGILTPGLAEYRVITVGLLSEPLRTAIETLEQPIRIIETSSIDEALLAANP